MHYGSMTTDLNKDYVVPNGYLLEVRADVKRQCNLCGDKTNAAAAPSLRSRLGEVGPQGASCDRRDATATRTKKSIPTTLMI